MANTTRISGEQQSATGRPVPPGDTGDGDSGVPAGEQGISNRPGDQESAVVAQDDADDEDEEDEDEYEGDEDDDADDDDSDSEDDDDVDEDDETTDLASEPGKPI